MNNDVNVTKRVEIIYLKNQRMPGQSKNKEIFLINKLNIIDPENCFC
jgi:hypothetical protein